MMPTPRGFCAFFFDNDAQASQRSGATCGSGRQQELQLGGIEVEGGVAILGAKSWDFGGNLEEFC